MRFPQSVLQILAIMLGAGVITQVGILGKRELVYRSVSPTPLGSVLRIGSARDLATGSRLNVTSSVGGCMVLIFFDPGCPACGKAAGDWAGRSRVVVGVDTLELMWLGTGQRERLQKWAIEHRIGPAAHMSALDFARLGADYTPQYFLVSGDRRLLAKGAGYPREVAEMTLPKECRRRDAATLGQDKQESQD